MFHYEQEASGNGLLPSEPNLTHGSGDREN